MFEHLTLVGLTESQKIEEIKKASSPKFEDSYLPVLEIEKDSMERDFGSIYQIWRSFFTEPKENKTKEKPEEIDTFKKAG